MWAMTATNSGWTVPLEGETFTRGKAEGTLLGGCITLIETSIGTPWELDTRGSILLLEDRGVKPYQLDRMLLHLKQAGKFEGVRGIVLGEFPESEPPEGSSVTVADVCRRILGPLRIPIVYGAPVGHTHAAHADDAAWRASETSRLGRRAHRNSRTGGARMTRPLHFHLSGIGGAAMAPLAGMLAESGHRVTGSDAGVYPPASTLLESLGIRWSERFRRRQSRSCAGHRRPRQCAFARQSGSRSGAGSQNSVPVAPANARGIFPAGPRFARRHRHARQNHDDVHALLDSASRRAAPEFPDRRRCRKFWAQLRPGRRK